MGRPGWLNDDRFADPLLDIDLSGRSWPIALTPGERALLLDRGNLHCLLEFTPVAVQPAADRTVIFGTTADGDYSARYVTATGHWQLRERSSDHLGVQGAAAPGATSWQAGVTRGVEMFWCPQFDRAGIRLKDNGCMGVRDAEIFSTAAEPNGLLPIKAFSVFTLGTSLTTEIPVRFRAFRTRATIRERPAEGVIIGDSTSGTPTAGFSNLGSYIYSGSEASTRLGIATLAKPGNTIAQQTTFWDASRYKGDGRVKWVSIMLGINDAATNRTAAQMRVDLQALITSIAASNPNAKILVSRPIPCKSYVAMGALRFAELDAYATSVMGGASPITGVHARLGDYYATLDDGDDNLLPLYDPANDHVHQGNIARAIMGLELRTALLSLGELA